MLDERQVQDLFRATDDADPERLCRYLHPEIVVTMIGVDGVDAPFDRDGYLRFLADSLAHRRDRGERTEHVPVQVMIGDATIVVRGYLRIISKVAADAYHPYTDLWKLRDGRIVEYDIAYGV